MVESVAVRAILLAHDPPWEVYNDETSEAQAEIARFLRRCGNDVVVTPNAVEHRERSVIAFGERGTGDRVGIHRDKPVEGRDSARCLGLPAPAPLV
jgi:hypothetical protein